MTVTKAKITITQKISVKTKIKDTPASTTHLATVSSKTPPKIVLKANTSPALSKLAKLQPLYQPPTNPVKTSAILVHIPVIPLKAITTPMKNVRKIPSAHWMKVPAVTKLMQQIYQAIQTLLKSTPPQ